MHSLRNLYPVAVVVGAAIGYSLYLSIMNYPYIGWLFYTAAVLILFAITSAYFWIEAQDLPEAFSLW
jgi:hypothetical protein